MKIKIKVRDLASDDKYVAKEVEAVKVHGLIALTASETWKDRFLVTHVPTGASIIGPFKKDDAERAFDECAKVCTKERGWDFNSPTKIPGSVRDDGRALTVMWKDFVAAYG